MRRGTFIQGSGFTRSGITFETPTLVTPVSGSDSFLLSPEVSPRPRKAEVDRHVRGWEHTSDHAPVWIELDDADLS